MDVIRELTKIPHLKATAVTVGTFDGVHLGHQKVLRRLVEAAAEVGGEAVVVTFDPHPKIVLARRDDSPSGAAADNFGVLTTLDEKIDLISEWGIDVVLVIPFTIPFSRTPADVFARDVLIKNLSAQVVVLSHDHGFGSGRSGNADMLRELGDGSLKVEVVEPVSVDGQVVSSTLIRRELSDGRVDRVRQWTGRDYSFSGNVTHGDGIGKTLGFSTANLFPGDPHKLLPADGVYCAQARIDGEWLGGMLNLGVRPTFGSNSRRLEVHLFQEMGSLYDSELTVRFTSRVRDERKFDSPQSLIKQLEQDKAYCLQYQQ